MLPFPSPSLENLTLYAGVWRYQEPAALGVQERDDLLLKIRLLKAFVMERVAHLRPGIDWHAEL